MLSVAHWVAWTLEDIENEKHWTQTTKGLFHQLRSIDFPSALGNQLRI